MSTSDKSKTEKRGVVETDIVIFPIEEEFDLDSISIENHSPENDKNSQDLAK